MGTEDDLYAPELLEPIIHRIQSLLTREKAAQTTLLSKSWSAAWWTRPTIDLDESHIPYDSSSYGEIDGLVKYATKTFRRYKESNLRINTFRLHVNKDWYGCSGLATKWTLKALKLGATDLTFRLQRYPKIGIPLRVLFRSKNIVSLRLKHSIIGRLKVLNCGGLKSLTLSYVDIASDMLFNLISCCPLIENLSLSRIYKNERDDDDDDSDDDDDVDDENDDDGDDAALPKLRSLVICHVQCKIQKLLLDALSSKFPNLKELTLNLSLDGARETQIISSHSVEILNFAVDEEKMHRVEFDVPDIRKFTFEGEYMPNLYFRSTMDQWEESHVSLTLTPRDELSTKWFLELSNFLTMLRLSRIHLCLHLTRNIHQLREKKKIDYQEGKIKGLNVLHEVEDLTINNKTLPSLSFNALLDGLFRICRPKTITQYVSTPNDNDDEIFDDDDRIYWDEGRNTRDNDIFLCKALERVMKVKCLLLPTHFRHGLTDLDEVIAQKLVDEEWKSQPMDSILDDLTSEQTRFRFQMKWKPSLNQYISEEEEEEKKDNEDEDEDEDEDDDHDDDDDDDF